MTDIDHAEARRIAEYHRDRTLYKDAWVLAAAYLDLREKAEAYLDDVPSLWDSKSAQQQVECVLIAQALRAALGEED